MGFRFRDHHTDDFNLCVRTRSQPYIAPRRQTVIKVPGKDGLVCFEDGYDNIKIEFECKIVNYDRYNRRKIIRSIGAWLSENTGKLILDMESELEYDVVLTVHDLTSEYRDPILPMEEFTVIFECKPHAYARTIDLETGLTWDGAFVRWSEADFDWKGDVPIIEPVNGDILLIENRGTYKALPIVQLSGICSDLTIGEFTISTLSGTIYIDSENLLVYSITNNGKINELFRFSGKFPELNPGDNLFPVSGSITSLAVQFIFRDVYI